MKNITVQKEIIKEVGEKSKQSMNVLQKKVKEYKKVSTLFVLILVSSMYFVYTHVYKTTQAISYQYSIVVRKTIEKTVEGSGKIVAVGELDIQQLSGGKVVSVLVSPGDFVKEGQVIARLDSRSQSIQVAQAKANYDKVINGATQEELDSLHLNVSSNQSSYDVIQKEQNIAVDNARRNLYSSNLVARSVYDTKITPYSPTVSGSYSCNEAREYSIVADWTDHVSFSGKGTQTGGAKMSSVPQKLDDCGLYISFDSSLRYDIGEWKVSIPNTLSASYTQNMNAYNQALESREKALLNASTTVASSQINLKQKTVGARIEDIAIAKANLDSAYLNYENTVIRAPFNGQIGSVSAIVGQQTSTQAGVATIITKDKIADILLNEIDIVNVKLGQEVHVSLDALPDIVFSGKVSQINTVGVASSNVVSFNVKVAINDADERIKSGMSVTSRIIVDKKENVLTLANGSIKNEKQNEKQNEKTVYYVLKKDGVARVKRATSTDMSMASTTQKRVRNKNAQVPSALATTPVKVYVTIGIANDIETEIIDGIQEGDEIVSKTIDANTTTAKKTTSFSLFGGNNRGGGR